MNKKRWACIAIALGCCSFDASALTGRPLGIVVVYNGVVVVNFPGPNRTDGPACVAAYPNRFAFNGNTDAGKAMLAVLLAAYAAGTQVTIAGEGTCSAWADAETVSWLTTTGS